MNRLEQELCAAHLVGPDSVIAMLRAKSVRVEGP
jgi:uncharacterized protein YbaP (TraB family)